MPSRRRSPVQHAPIVQAFAARLRELRHARGMSQVALAREATVTVSHVSRLETSRAAPGIDLVERLAKALSTTVADLLPTAEPPDTVSMLRQQARRLCDALIPSA